MSFDNFAVSHSPSGGETWSLITMKIQHLCWLLVAAFCCHVATPAVVFNVGLPRTGTTSIHQAFALLNFSSSHVMFNRTRFDLELGLSKHLAQFRQSGTGVVQQHFDQFQAFTDTPCYGLIPSIKAHYPNAFVVATWRDRSSWIHSMSANPQAGGSFLMKQAHLLGDSTNKRSRTERLGIIYDNHEKLLNQYGIPRIDIAVRETL